MTAAEKAIPVPDELNQPYWDGAKAHKLVLQHCRQCRTVSARPRVVCPRCHGEEFEWQEVSGKGIIHSYSIVHQTTAAGFQDEVPYVVANVSIDEDSTCYITCNLLVDKADHDKLTISLPVVVEFEDRGNGVVVPQFRLA